MVYEGERELRKVVFGGILLFAILRSITDIFKPLACHI